MVKYGTWLEQNLLRNDMGNSCATNAQTKNKYKYWVQNYVCQISRHL